MRKDAYYVATGLPRSGVGYYRNLPSEYRKAKKFKIDENLEVHDEFSDSVLPMKSKNLGWDRKAVHIHYSFLQRYIESQIGKRWDDVYSEVKKAFAKQTKANLTAINYIKDLILTNPHFEDGKVYDPNRSYSRHGWYQYVGLYVENGVIKKTNEKRVSRKNQKKKRDEIYNSDPDEVTYKQYKFKRRDGIWYLEVEKQREALRFYNQKPESYIENYFEYYSLSTKELKKFNLKNKVFEAKL